MESLVLTGVDVDVRKTKPELQVSLDANRHIFLRFDFTVCNRINVFFPNGEKHVLALRVTIDPVTKQVSISIVPESGDKLLHVLNLVAGKLTFVASEDLENGDD